MSPETSSAYVTVVAPPWVSPPVAIALGARDRWHGMRTRPLDSGLVFRGSGAHGYGLTNSIAVVGVDAAGVVIGCRVLNPRRRLRIRRAVWLLELPVVWPRPQLGAKLMWRRTDFCPSRPLSGGAGF